MRVCAKRRSRSSEVSVAATVAARPIHHSIHMPLPALLAAIGLLPSAPLAPHNSRVYTRAPFPRATEIPFDIHFLRGAKNALRKSLDEEGGVLVEDAQACVEALSAVNPSLPNPSEDSDLWSGTWSFATSSLLSSALAAEGSVVLSESGALELTCELTSAESSATLSVQGQVAAADDTVLELQCERIALSSEALVAACAEATGLSLAEAGGEWVAAAPLPSLKLAQRYLDQDTHIVGALVEGERRDPPLVLFKK